jgi:N utilization substance protein B
MSRSEARIKIMTILYQISIYEKAKMTYDTEKIIKEATDIENEYIKDMVYGVITYQKELDEKANAYLKDWKIERLGLTDIAIMRLSIYEMLYMDTPKVVVINEALELAKKYSDEEVRGMINSVLDKIYKEESDE